MKRLIKLGCVVLVAMSITGCINNSINSYENADKHATINRVIDKRVITDRFLAGRLLIQEIRESETNDGYKQIQLCMKSDRTGVFNTNTPHNIIYRFDWFDDQGMLVEPLDSTGWRRRSIMPGDDVVFTSTAPNKKCLDFKIRLKEVK